MMKELKFHGDAIHLGRGSISAVRDLGAKRAFLVTGGSSMFSNGSIGKIEALLKEKILRSRQSDRALTA